jgi:hypothetical protein
MADQHTEIADAAFGCSISRARIRALFAGASLALLARALTVASLYEPIELR